jgi:uncharacterized membrane protein (UPF0127 family)
MRGDFGAVAFTIDVADDARERAQGLMFVESMPRFTGMLFIYERPQPLSFWMRNTLIPLDMLFLTDAGEVYHIHENAVPLDETPIRAPGEGLAVLELNGGLSRQLGLRVGDVVRHPGLPQDAAAWPCAD